MLNDIDTVRLRLMLSAVAATERIGRQILWLNPPPEEMFSKAGTLGLPPTVRMGMRREIYDEFVAAARDGLFTGEPVHFQDPELEDCPALYALPGCRLRRDGTVYEAAWEGEFPIHQGVFIDIIPLDSVPDGAAARGMFLRRYLKRQEELQQAVRRELMQGTGIYGAQNRAEIEMLWERRRSLLDRQKKGRSLTILPGHPEFYPEDIIPGEVIDSPDVCVFERVSLAVPRQRFGRFNWQEWYANNVREQDLPILHYDIPDDILFADREYIEKSPYWR